MEDKEICKVWVYRPGFNGLDQSVSLLIQNVDILADLREHSRMIRVPKRRVPTDQGYTVQRLLLVIAGGAMRKQTTENLLRTMLAIRISDTSLLEGRSGILQINSGKAHFFDNVFLPDHVRF